MCIRDSPLRYFDIDSYILGFVLSPSPELRQGQMCIRDSSKGLYRFRFQSLILALCHNKRGIVISLLYVIGYLYFSKHRKQAGKAVIELLAKPLPSVKAVNYRAVECSVYPIREIIKIAIKATLHLLEISLREKRGLFPLPQLLYVCLLYTSLSVSLSA